jgi:hypothetical protein
MVDILKLYGLLGGFEGQFKIVQIGVNSFIIRLLPTSIPGRKAIVFDWSGRALFPKSTFVVWQITN